MGAPEAAGDAPGAGRATGRGSWDFCDSCCGAVPRRATADLDRCTFGRPPARFLVQPPGRERLGTGWPRWP